MDNINLKQLPIGIESFQEIIENDYLYVDKTDLLFDVMYNYKYVFLSRPRRFGKSLVLSTLENIFKGKKELFKGLKIESLYDFKDSYPVINLDMSFNKTLDSKELEENIKNILLKSAKKLGVKLDSSKLCSIMLNNLIYETKNKFNKSVVVLIDNRDKPILDRITDLNERKLFNDILTAFYTVLKSRDSDLQFVFLTGTIHFSKCNEFGGFNNVFDISLNSRYGTLCGYTQNEIETTLKPYLDSVDLEELKNWYGSYNFLGESIYNPYSIFLFIKNKKVFSKYFSIDESEKSLLELIKENSHILSDLDNLIISDNETNSLDIERININMLLLQAGYLTIKKTKSVPFGFFYKLGFPNIEIKKTLLEKLDLKTKNT